MNAQTLPEAEAAYAAAPCSKAKRRAQRGSASAGLTAASRRLLLFPSTFLFLCEGVRHRGGRAFRKPSDTIHLLGLRSKKRTHHDISHNDDGNPSARHRAACVASIASLSASDIASRQAPLLPCRT